MKDHYLTYPDLASERLGATVVYASNDTHGTKECLNLEPTLDGATLPSDWIPEFDSTGKAWAVIRLACKSNLSGFRIETAPSDAIKTMQIAIDALHFSSHVEDWELADFLDWDVLVPEKSVATGEVLYLDSDSHEPYTHIRIHILSTGGLSRVSAFGTPYVDWSQIKADDRIDLASITLGGQIIASSGALDEAKFLIAPTKSSSSSDGWLTKTTTEAPWVIVKLAHRGFVEKLIIDTYNFHDERATSCSLDYCMTENDTDLSDPQIQWKALLSNKGLKPHRENPFSGKDIKDHEAITHVRFTIYPHGGVSRLRIIGSIKK